MERAVMTHTDGDQPPRTQPFVAPASHVLWTWGTWAWRLALLGALTWLLFEIRGIRADLAAEAEKTLHRASIKGG